MQLKAYFISEMHFALQEGYTPSGAYNIPVDISDLTIEVESFQHEDNPRDWHFRLKVALDIKEPKYPYRFIVIMDGFFEVVKDYPMDQVELLVKVNAPALLYSSIRELLVTITSRSIYAPIFLPTFNFFEYLKTLPAEETQGSSGKETLSESTVEPKKPSRTTKKPSKAKK